MGFLGLTRSPKLDRLVAGNRDCARIREFRDYISARDLSPRESGG